MAELRGLPAVPDVPFEEMTDAEQLAYLSRRSRGKMLEILNLPTDLDALGGDVMMQHRRYRMQAEVAQSLQTVQVRVDDASLRHQERSDLLEVMREQLKNIRLPSKD